MAALIQAKSILRKARGIDSWFIANAGMNLYRGCAHDCAYCDGRAEKYGVKGDFAREIEVKLNALDILRKELAAAAPDRGEELWPELSQGARAPPPGFIMLGGGVGDAYQPLEAEHKLTRGALELLDERRLPVHILTKSTLVLRDLDLLKKINGSTRAVVSFSISSSNDETSRVFEPGVPPPSERLRALSALKEEGISCGVYLMPVIPFVSDSPLEVERSVDAAKRAGADFMLFAGMTLKEGRQKEHFLDVLGGARPDCVNRCRALYMNKDRWGMAAGGYYGDIDVIFAGAARGCGMPPRMPRRLFKDFVTGRDLAVVLLDHINAMKELEGKRSPFGWASHKLSCHRGPLSELKGIGNAALKVIEEIVKTGTSSLYEELIQKWTQPASSQ